MRNDEFEASLGGFGSALLDEDPDLSKLFGDPDLGCGVRSGGGAEGFRERYTARFWGKETVVKASRHIF